MSGAGADLPALSLPDWHGRQACRNAIRAMLKPNQSNAYTSNIMETVKPDKILV